MYLDDENGENSIFNSPFDSEIEPMEEELSAINTVSSIDNPIMNGNNPVCNPNNPVASISSPAADINHPMSNGENATTSTCNQMTSIDGPEININGKSGDGHVTSVGGPVFNIEDPMTSANDSVPCLDNFVTSVDNLMPSIDCRNRKSAAVTGVKNFASNINKILQESEDINKVFSNFNEESSNSRNPITLLKTLCDYCPRHKLTLECQFKTNVAVNPGGIFGSVLAKSDFTNKDENLTNRNTPRCPSVQNHIRPSLPGPFYDCNIANRIFQQNFINTNLKANALQGKYWNRIMLERNCHQSFMNNSLYGSALQQHVMNINGPRGAFDHNLISRMPGNNYNQCIRTRTLPENAFPQFIQKHFQRNFQPITLNEHYSKIFLERNLIGRNISGKSSEQTIMNSNLPGRSLHANYVNDYLPVQIFQPNTAYCTLPQANFQQNIYATLPDFVQNAANRFLVPNLTKRTVYANSPDSIVSNRPDVPIQTFGPNIANTLTEETFNQWFKDKPHQMEVRLEGDSTNCSTSPAMSSAREYARSTMMWDTPQITESLLGPEGLSAVNTKPVKEGLVAWIEKNKCNLVNDRELNLDYAMNSHRQQVMNKFLTNVGVPEEWSMIDVIDLEEDHLDNLPKKVKAVLLLFPKGDQHEEHCQSEQEAIESDGQVVSDRVYFIKLDSNNSSGTVSLIHAVANADDELQLGDDSPLKEFLERTKDMSPEERGQELEMDETLCCVHDTVAKEGQTEAPEADEETNLHFITFVAIDEQLYELDAHKNFPVNQGSTSMETLMKDAVAVCKKFMERDPENVNFSIMALVGGDSDEEVEE